MSKYPDTNNSLTPGTKSNHAQTSTVVVGWLGETTFETRNSHPPWIVCAPAGEPSPMAAAAARTAECFIATISMAPVSTHYDTLFNGCQCFFRPAMSDLPPGAAYGPN
ncbi:MAG: hypothetical protein IIC49_06535 [Planctomycetes bacterium]|nr:hypothetical protein [Planctomycetota bacterium]